MAYIRGQFYTYEDINGHMKLPKSMPMDIFDELVVMRYAELNKNQIVAAEKRAMKEWNGNIGCQALYEKYGKKSLFDTTIEKFARKKEKETRPQKETKETLTP